MIRKQNWLALLGAAVSVQIKAPFDYGKRDCCTSACDLIVAMTDTDLMAELRGKYRTAIGAVRVVKKTGAVDLLGLARNICAEHGCEEIDTVYAGVGDLVVTDQAFCDMATGQALGVCMGPTAVFPTDTGWVSLPR
ncbi:MAG: hypothetical protein JKY34_12675, partial [Kordiimonadaceae bacterium]|nr:hypothetical protein [Kordiimonadaceae bacterium]